MSDERDPGTHADVDSMSMHDPLEGISAEGTIVTGAHRDRIAPPFLPVLEAFVDAATSSAREVSLYVYGSVATGMARAPGSDVDLVAVGLPHDRAAELSKELSSRFRHLCRGVSVGAAAADDHRGVDDEAYGNRVFLRHYCVLLAGPDLASGLPAYPADAAAARGFNGDIGIHADQWRTERVPGAGIEHRARRIARKTLFAVAGLVSIHDRTWTTDRIGAARRWGQVVPGLAEVLHRLEAWGEGLGEPTERAVREAVDGPVARIVDDFAATIGLWGHVDGHR